MKRKFPCKPTLADVAAHDVTRDRVTPPLNERAIPPGSVTRELWAQVARACARDGVDTMKALAALIHCDPLVCASFTAAADEVLLDAAVEEAMEGGAEQTR